MPEPDQQWRGKQIPKVNHLILCRLGISDLTFVATVTIAVRVMVSRPSDSIRHMNHLVASLKRLSAELLAFRYVLNLWVSWNMRNFQRIITPTFP